MQTKGGERAAAEDAAVTSEETKPTDAETEVRGVAEPAPRLKKTSFFEEIRRALAEAKNDPTVTADLLNDIRALQPTGRQGRGIPKAQASKHRVHPCGRFRMGGATHTVRDEWLRYECLRRLFARLPSAAVKLASLASLRSTPGSMAEFADALRDSVARKYMPFGKDFELTTGRMAGEMQRAMKKDRLLDGAVVA